MCGVSISLSLALLTLSLAVRSTPRSNSRPHVVLWPSLAAQWSAVRPFYHNRQTETEREIGQCRDTQNRRREEKKLEQQGGHTEGQGQVRVR